MISLSLINNSNSGEYQAFLLVLGIGVKWKYLQNHVAPDLFYAYSPQKT